VREENKKSDRNGRDHLCFSHDAGAIRERQVSSQEVVDAYLKRIATINPALNAVVQLRSETALGGWQSPAF
jgi:Asp-tRNA(Asn)/Glu-tRNA(Gln) amidotransferase A subunit family amidase